MPNKVKFCTSSIAIILVWCASIILYATDILCTTIMAVSCIALEIQFSKTDTEKSLKSDEYDS